MKDLEEKLLRDMLGDLVASKGATRKVITENVVAFVKKITTQHRAQRTGDTMSLITCEHGYVGCPICGNPTANR